MGKRLLLWSLRQSAVIPYKYSINSKILTYDSMKTHSLCLSYS